MDSSHSQLWGINSIYLIRIDLASAQFAPAVAFEGPPEFCEVLVVASSSSSYVFTILKFLLCLHSSRPPANWTIKNEEDTRTRHV